MAESVNRQVLLKSRPEGVPRLENFQLTQAPMRQPGEGEVLKRILYLSLDPYMRGRMSDLKSYAAPGSAWAGDGRWHGRGDRQIEQSGLDARRRRRRLWRLARIRAFQRRGVAQT
jgi:hypothetical protein